MSSSNRSVAMIVSICLGLSSKCICNLIIIYQWLADQAYEMYTLYCQLFLWLCGQIDFSCPNFYDEIAVEMRWGSYR